MCFETATITLMDRNKIVFIIPVYNESRVIYDVLSNVLSKYRYVVCVDDGSTDNSIEEIEKTGAFLLRHPINMGQGAALQTGIEFARQLPVEYFVTFDADGQHSLGDVKKMLQTIKSNDYDIVLGSRFLGDTIGMKSSKKIVLKLAIGFSNFMSGMKLTDTHNGLRVFNRHVAETMKITMPDMSHASEIIELISENNYKYVESPVTIEYTEYSKSKGQSVFNAINIGFDTLLRKISR